MVGYSNVGCAEKQPPEIGWKFMQIEKLSFAIGWN